MDREPIDIDPPEDDGQGADRGGPAASNFETPARNFEQMAKIKAELALIKDALDTDRRTSTASGTGVSLPLRELLSLIPPQLLATTSLGDDADAQIEVPVGDLMDQLKSGRVAVTVSDLVMHFPVGLVAPDAYEDSTTEVNLPLPLVIAAIDPNLMRQQNAQQKPAADIAAIPDPFSRSDADDTAGGDDAPAPGVNETPPASDAVEESIPNAAAPPTITQPEPVADNRDENLEKDVAADEDESDDALETLTAPHTTRAPLATAEGKYAESGVNLNTATVDQILSLSGVSASLAERIVTYRDQNGRFTSVFDLKNVGRIGRVTFRKMTGMPFSTSGHHRSERIKRLLSLSDENMSHLPTVTRALAKRPGFSGTVISNNEGLLLAQDGAEDIAARIAAVVPKLVTQLANNLDVMDVGQMRSLSITLDEQMFTIIRSGAIFLTAIHDRRKLTKTQLTLVHRVAAELEWLLSHRAYVA
jgi:competence ComEA-like helix-hairpin-helix protein